MLRQQTNDPAFVFGLRLCISLTCGMLFTLIPAPAVRFILLFCKKLISLIIFCSHLPTYNPFVQGVEGYQYPQASSVYITCALVSWFPSLDAASAVKKSIERVLGTAIGAAFALAIGFISLQIGEGTRGQAAFIGVILSVLFFVCPYYLAKTEGFGYAQLLGFVTLGVITMSFYNASPHQPWSFACYRTAALLVGCCISVIVSLIVLPKPVEAIIDQQIKMSMRNMGKAVRMLLEAAASESKGEESGGGTKLPLITDIIMNGERFEEDEVHSAYAAAYNITQALKTMLPLLKYDPFLLWSRRFDKKKIAFYAKQVQMQRARLNRFIASTISMDTLIRLGIQDVNMVKFDLCNALIETGKRVELVLDIKDGTEGERSDAAHLLLAENLAHIRQVRMNLVLLTKDDGSYMEKIERLLKQEHPDSIEFSSEEDTVCFFLKHVEHVIMRCVRLHYFYCCFQDGVSPSEKEEDECAA